MNTERLLSAALAICCLFALATSAATLDSSVDTTPDDVVDVDVASLPLPSDDVTALKRQIQSDAPGEKRSRQPPKAGDDGPPEETFDDPSNDRQPRGAPDDQTGEQQGSAGETVRKQGQGPAEPSLLDRLLALLAALLDALLSLLPALALVAIVAVAIRFRERIRAALSRFADRFGPASDAAQSVTAERLPAPSNEVAAAWFEMVRRTGLPDEATRTPRQCASAAVAAGADADVVRSLTETFEAVTYGGASVTEERRARARRDIRRIRTQLAGGEGR